MSTNAAVGRFFRKTKRGRILLRPKERYLRADLGFGIIKPSEDSAPSSSRTTGSMLALPNREAVAQVLHDGHATSDGLPLLVVLDTNVVLAQLDLLETNCPALYNVVVCDTVIAETKKNSLNAHRRLVGLSSGGGRSYLLFPNEHHEETYDVRAPGESPNDHCDRLIRKTAGWFAENLKGLARVVFLSDDAESRKRCRAEYGARVEAMSAHEFGSSISKAYPGIMDKIAFRSNEGKALGERAETVFPEHLTTIEVDRQLKAGTVKQGLIRFEKGAVKATLSLHEQSGGETVSSTFQVVDTNRAVDGDRVAVRVLDAALKTCAVVGIIKRNWRALAGALLLLDKQDEGAAADADAGLDGGFSATPRLVQFVPVDARFPRATIQTRQYDLLKEDRVVVQFDAWDRTSKYPMGHFVKSLGKAGEKATETATVLMEHDIPTSDFSRSVLACLPDPDEKLESTAGFSRRLDLRGVDAVCSIDPPGCKDIDDALHARPHPSNPNHLEVGVHIADVTHYVKIDSAMDREALDRATSTYLVERRLDMLPSLLTTDMCSLVSNKDRLAFSVIWEYDPRTSQFVGAPRFAKSVIRSRASLTYDEGQAFISSNARDSSIAKSVCALNEIALILKQRRLDAGALTLASQEVKFQLDDETHDPTDVKAYEHFEAHSLVEEFMLLANVAVAERIERAYPRRALLRRHPPPTTEQLTRLLKTAACAGVVLDGTSSKTLAATLDAATRPDQPFFNQLLRIAATRAMQQAVYFCTGDFDDKREYCHYGLAAPTYTHFTSPIRRYADVVAHRLLAAAEGLEPLPQAYEKHEDVHRIAEHLNRRHRNAQRAGRKSVDVNTVVFFRNKGPTESFAYVSSISDDNQVSVMVPDFGLEDKLSFEGNAEEAWTFDEDGMRLLRGDGSVVLRVFDRIEVIVGVETLDIEAKTEKLIIRVKPSTTKAQATGKPKKTALPPKAAAAPAPKRRKLA